MGIPFHFFLHAPTINIGRVPHSLARKFLASFR
jgi:hypothetical protein